MPFDVEFPITRGVPLPGLVVDDRLHRGFVFDIQNHRKLFVYDLRELRLTHALPLPDPIVTRQNSSREWAVVDADHHRIFYTLTAQRSSNLQEGVQGTANCNASPIAVLDTLNLTWQVRHIDCVDVRLFNEAAAVKTGVVIDGFTYDRATNRLFVVGVPSHLDEVSRFRAFYPYEPTLYLQVDPDTFRADWVVDAGEHCNYHYTADLAPDTFARVPGGAVAYCLQGGNNANTIGGRGSTAFLPIANGRPDPKGLRIAPVLRDPTVRTSVDPVSGRLLVLARILPFGPAVWVFDPLSERFVGVVPTGVPATGPTARGFEYAFDEATGRLYMRTTRGYVILDARHTPLPGGQTYSVDVDPQAYADGNVGALSIDSPLRRVFRADNANKRWVVLEDNVPQPPPAVPPDPDSGTADIEEREGRTDRIRSSSTNAAGAHILNVGGVPPMLQQATFRSDCARRNIDPSSSCVVPVLVAPGDREYFLAQTSTATGSTAGAGAYASAGRASPRDFATDADSRALADCGGARLSRLYGPVQPIIDTFCPQITPGADQAFTGPLEGFRWSRLSGGTRPHDNPADDAPIPSSACSDLGGAPADVSAAPWPSESRPMGNSSAACDSRKGTARAAASLAPVELAFGDVPLVIGRSRSSVETRLDPELGQVSVADAVVEDVRIGKDIVIGRIHTHAESRAKGRSGTTATVFTRQISDVTAPGLRCLAACDPKKVAASLSAALPGLLDVRAHDPVTVASPRGYTGLVAKHPDQLASDIAINNDDTVTANGLDLVFVNDFNRGTAPLVSDGQLNAARSRVVVGLAGVQVESHYGVFPLPVTGDGEGSGSSGSSERADLAGVGGIGALAPDGVGPYAIAPLPASAVSDAADTRSAVGGFRFPRTVEEAIRLIVNNPAQAALLALLLALLASPVYLAVRRRTTALALEAA